MGLVRVFLGQMERTAADLGQAVSLQVESMRLDKYKRPCVFLLPFLTEEGN